MVIDIKIKTAEQVSRFIDMMSSGNRFVFKRHRTYADMFSVYAGTAAGLDRADETDRIIKTTELLDSFCRSFDVTAVQYDEPDDMYTKKEPDDISNMLGDASFRSELSGIGSLAARSYVALDKICEAYRRMYLHEPDCTNRASKPGYFLYAATVKSTDMLSPEDFVRCFRNVYGPAMLISKTSLGMYPEKNGIRKYVIVSAANTDCQYPHMFSRLCFYTDEGAIRCFRNHTADWLRYFGVLPDDAVNASGCKEPEKHAKTPVNKWLCG